LPLAVWRSWISYDSEKHNEVEYHRIVAWDKLADTCQQAPIPFLYGTGQ
jgi:single-stranded DNA-binding protein